MVPAHPQLAQDLIGLTRIIQVHIEKLIAGQARIAFSAVVDEMERCLEEVVANYESLIDPHLREFMWSSTEDLMRRELHIAITELGLSGPENSRRIFSIADAFVNGRRVWKNAEGETST